MDKKTLYCAYCHEVIKDKKKDSRKAEGKRYHIECVRKLRKTLDKMKQEGKVKPGQEHKVSTELNS